MITYVHEFKLSLVSIACLLIPSLPLIYIHFPQIKNHRIIARNQKINMRQRRLKLIFCICHSIPFLDYWRSRRRRGSRVYSQTSSETEKEHFESIVVLSSQSAQDYILEKPRASIDELRVSDSQSAQDQNLEKSRASMDEPPVSNLHISKDQNLVTP